MADHFFKPDPHSSVIVEAMNAGTWQWNVQTGEARFNERWAEIIGYTLDELEPVSIKTWERFAHPKDLEISYRHFKKVFEKKETFYSFEARMKHKDGHWVWVLDSGKVMKWTEAGEPLFAVGTHIDITDKRNIQTELEHSERNLRQIIDNTKDIIYRTDVNGRFTYLSRAWENLLGHSRNASLGQSFRLYLHEADLTMFDGVFQCIEAAHEHREVRGFRLRHHSGHPRYFETSVGPIYEEGKITGYAGTARDITELHKQQKRIEYLSYHDQLTGFYNRHYLEEVRSEINQEDNFPLCIISMDLNNLKVINDRFGHHIGDKAIQRVAEVITRHVPVKDYLFRMGGDEFMVFLPNTDDEDAITIRSAVMDALEREHRADFPLSVAYGFYTKKNVSETLFDDIRIADWFMYHHKAASKSNGQ